MKNQNKTTDKRIAGWPKDSPAKGLYAMGDMAWKLHKENEGTQLGQVLFSLAMDLGYLASNNHDVRRLLDEVGRGQLSGLGIVGQAAINQEERRWQKNRDLK